ncbi:MAG: EF-hand domain-containing protein [Marinobacterium sp.]|nr:EF-hand domain-containing protein [Marinobacterium sp.]
MKFSPFSTTAFLILTTSLNALADNMSASHTSAYSVSTTATQPGRVHSTAPSRPVIIDLFSVLDGNNDDQLSQHEVRERPALTRYFHRLDANRDGLLNRKEFAVLGIGKGFHISPGNRRIHQV